MTAAEHHKPENSGKSEKSSAQRVIDYYNTRESRWGYQLLLGGTKHFGYYPPGQERISMRRAMRNMEFQLGQSLALPPGSRVLDAGCGMGRVAVQAVLAQGAGDDATLAGVRRLVSSLFRQSTIAQTNFDLRVRDKFPLLVP